MSGLVSRHYGISLEELGHVEHDDTVWLTVRRNRPLLVDSPTSKSARNVERIARRVLALAIGKGEDAAAAVPIPSEEATLYAVLGVTRSANDEEVRRAYKRQREIYANGGLATVSLLDAAQLAASQRKLDEAYDTPPRAVRRRAYDLSTFPASAPEEARRAGDEPRPRRRAVDAPEAAARDRARHGVHRSAPPQGARVARRRARRHQREDEDLAIPPAGARRRPVRGPPAHRLHARLSRRAREAAPARPDASPEDLPAQAEEELAARGKEIA